MTEGESQAGTEQWRVMGKPSDSASLVTREVEAETADGAKERYLEKIGHKNVRGLRARSLAPDNEQEEKR